MEDRETLGPAETIINSLLAHHDHLYHGRPGIVIPDAGSPVGVRWQPVTHKAGDNGVRVVYRLEKRGKKQHRIEIGSMNGDSRVVRNGANVVGEYRPSGLYKEVAVWFYRQIATVWQMDNEFAARWASYAFRQEHRDLKVALAAFMLVQSRRGDPVRDGGEVLFADEDYRDVGEAMMLLQEKGRDLNPKLLLRIWEILSVPEIADLNRELGFGRSARRAFLGRWPKAVEKWLRYREDNPKMLEGLVRAGFSNTVKTLARKVGYKPTSDWFFEVLRWNQKQADDGRREIAIGKEVKAAESWDHMTEEGICQKIEAERPGWKRIVGLLPKKIGVTRAIMAAALESSCLSDKDIVILTPTLEDLGLLRVQSIKDRHAAALARAEDMRAANIARNVRSQELREKMEAGADKAAQRVVEEVMRDLRVYFIVDRSASMRGALERAKPLIAKFLQSFPPDRVHASVFNTVGKEINIRTPAKSGALDASLSTRLVEHAFTGIDASGATHYASGVEVLQRHQPKETEDSLFIFVGDEEQKHTFEREVEASGLRPMAFGFLKIVAEHGAAGWRRRHYGHDYATAVRDTAAKLGIPCFMIGEDTFEDPYAIPRIVRNLVAATPVGRTVRQAARPRVTLVDQIIKTPLLQRPAWA